ncbi:MAG: exodeoxyribonuclease VII small subunit [Deltaproteobacteria bacterium]|nr:exodeoxyribonuclease VII small subunit [Deltaproteobacteria bacterium]
MPGTRKTRKKTDAAPGAHEALPYEQVVERLEATVERLEAGELPLEDQLAAFEEGMQLLRAGQKLLDGAERRVEKLLADGAREPFEDED